MSQDAMKLALVWIEAQPEPRILGALKVINALREAMAEQPAQKELVAWRELCRRLYVELFHCDQQMMATRDEEGDPMWQQGATVRDVLADAKAALETPPQPAQQQELLSLSGWKWMAHPSRNGGQPIPVQIFEEDGVTYYRPFDTDSTKFDWSLKGEDWCVITQQSTAQHEPVADEHQAFIDSLPSDMEDKMFEQIHYWARQSYARHQRSTRGQTITAADSSDNHIIWAALRWAKENAATTQAQPAQQGVDEFDVGWNAARRFYTSPPASKPLTDEPTKEMLDAAERIDWSDADVRGNIVNMWQAMCAAAPQRKPLPQTPPAYANINQRIAYKAGWRDAETAHGIKGDA